MSIHSNLALKVCRREPPDAPLHLGDRSFYRVRRHRAHDGQIPRRVVNRCTNYSSIPVRFCARNQARFKQTLLRSLGIRRPQVRSGDVHRKRKLVYQETGGQRNGPLCSPRGPCLSKDKAIRPVDDWKRGRVSVRVSRDTWQLDAETVYQGRGRAARTQRRATGRLRAVLDVDRPVLLEGSPGRPYPFRRRRSSEAHEDSVCWSYFEAEVFASLTDFSPPETSYDGAFLVI